MFHIVDPKAPGHSDPDYWENPPDHYRHAVTWRLVAEVMALHVPDRDLRVYELHPAGGMGDTLSMRQMDGRSTYGEELNDFRAWRRMGEPGEGRCPDALPDGGFYMHGAIREETFEATLRGLLHALGLNEGRTPRSPYAHPRVLTHFFMAALLTPHTHDERAWQWRSGMADSSGYCGTGARNAFNPEQPHFQHVRTHLPREVRGGPDPLYDIWFLTHQHQYNPNRDAIRLIVDAATATAWLNRAPPASEEEPSTEEAFDLREAFAKHGSMEAFAAWVWEQSIPKNG